MALTLLQALKYANTLLEDVLKAIDTNHDGRISYAGQQEILLH
jgi:hypothetical protein